MAGFYQTFCQQPTIERPARKTLAMPYSYEKELEEMDKLEVVKERLQKQLATFQTKIQSLEIPPTRDLGRV